MEIHIGKSNGWHSVTLIQRHESQFICEVSEQTYSFRWKIRRVLINSTIFQHPDQKPGCRKFWRLSGFARSKRVGCVTCIWESYMGFPSLTILLIHDVHTSALWRSTRIFSFFSTLFVIEEVECVFTSFFHVKLLTVELWVSLNTLHF